MVKPNALASARSHWPFLVIISISAALLLTNLGAGYLWADEGDTAVLASNIVRFGLPKAWDGTTFMDSDFGARVNGQMIMVTSPWLQYYVTAAFFRQFGESTFAARLPFALAGLLTIGEVYFFALRATANRQAALLASILTMCSVQFLLFCRQSRYYAFAMLLTCLLIDIFLRMKSPKCAVLFSIVAVLLFHTHPIGLVPVFALGALALIHPTFSAQRRWFGITIGPILILTAPWFLIARTGYTENAELVSSVRDFIIRLAQYGIECASVAPLIGIGILCLVGFAARSRIGRELQDSERRLLISIFSVVIGYALAMTITQRPAALWVTGIRYTSAIIPLFAIAAAVLIMSFGRIRRFILLPLVLIFTLTKLALITPWICWTDKNPDPENKIVAFHVPTKTLAAFFPIEDFLYVKDLWRPNIGTVGHCIELLRQYAQPGDLVITNYESEPLYFHTRLPQGMKIMEEDAIYHAARRYGLPEYVFGVDHVHWIVWRFNWDDYLGIRWVDLEHYLLTRGAKIDDRTNIEETGWENRENIHFHRFSADTYLFTQETNLAPAHIFRVDWPVQSQAKVR
jgi:hypothetical protein